TRARMPPTGCVPTWFRRRSQARRRGALSRPDRNMQRVAFLGTRRPGAARPEEAGELETALRAVVTGEVRFEAGDRALYSTDASNYRHEPIGVVVPRTVDDIVRGMAVCARHDALVLGRGGGTSLAGQCCNVGV